MSRMRNSLWSALKTSVPTEQSGTAVSKLTDVLAVLEVEPEVESRHDAPWWLGPDESGEPI
jgi:hypothetical protein